MKIFFVFLTVLILAHLTAQAASNTDPFHNFSGPSCSWFTSGTGKAIAIFILFALAIASLFKKIKWRYSLLLAVLLFSLFGASEIVDAMSTGNNDKYCI